MLWCKIGGIGCFYITSGSQVVKEKMSFYFELAVVIDFFLLNFFFCLDYSGVNIVFCIHESSISSLNIFIPKIIGKIFLSRPQPLVFHTRLHGHSLWLTLRFLP
jgi:hypothetical protein